MPEDPSGGNSRRSAWIDELVRGMHDLKLFEKEYAALQKEDDQLTIAVLRSHLIVEDFIERYLAAEGWAHGFRFRIPAKRWRVRAETLSLQRLDSITVPPPPAVANGP